MAYERIIIEGNLGKSPELRTSSKSNQSVTDFTVAVNKKRNGTATTTWYKVTAWGANAEVVSQYLQKGSRVLIEGSDLKASAYIGKDNIPHATLELTADRIIFLDGASDNESDEGDEGDKS